MSRDVVGWTPSEADPIKINVDGAVFGEEGVGLGLVVRDHESQVIHAACQQLLCSWDVSVVEAKAIVLGLKMGIQCYARSIIVENDCLQVVNLINKKKWNGSYLVMINREIDKLASYFDVVRFVHVFREANVVAHIMAHLYPLDFSTRV